MVLIKQFHSNPGSLFGRKRGNTNTLKMTNFSNLFTAAMPRISLLMNQFYFGISESDTFTSYSLMVNPFCVRTVPYWMTIKFVQSNSIKVRKYIEKIHFQNGPFFTTCVIRAYQHMLNRAESSCYYYINRRILYSLSLSHHKEVKIFSSCFSIMMNCNIVN